MGPNHKLGPASVNYRRGGTVSSHKPKWQKHMYRFHDHYVELLNELIFGLNSPRQDELMGKDRELVV